MPGFVTHYLFGVKSYKSLNNRRLKEIIRNNRNSFSLGLQGPDIFFYFLPTMIGKKINIASKIHKENTNKFFQEMINCMTDLHGAREYEIACAYIHGFMGHYILDTNMHPYVYSRVGTSTTKKTMGRHYGLETDIDREVLWEYKKLRQADFSHSARIDLSICERNVISTLLHNVILNTYDIDISVNLIKTAITSFYIECALLTDSTEYKYKTINGIEHYVFGYDILSPLLINDIPHSEDPCNEKHNKWGNPWDNNHNSTDSVFDIIDKASITYVEYMNLMQTALDSAYHLVGDNSSAILEKLANKSYTSGLDCNIKLKR